MDVFSLKCVRVDRCRCNSEPAALDVKPRMLSSSLNLRSICASFQRYSDNTGIAMRTYYFDTRDGIPTRDRRGLEFPTAAGAIEHSKELARRLRNAPRLKDPDLLIAVVDESGAEIHREQVYSDATDPCISLGN